MKEALFQDKEKHSLYDILRHTNKQHSREMYAQLMLKMERENEEKAERRKKRRADKMALKKAKRDAGEDSGSEISRGSLSSALSMPSTEDDSS